MPLEDHEASYLAMLMSKAKCYDEKPLARKQYFDYHMFRRGMRALKPHRATSLTRTEEKLRCRLTWMDFDEKLYMVGSGVGLHRHVINAKEMHENLKDVHLVFEDEVPIWISLSQDKMMIPPKFRERLAARKAFRRMNKLKRRNQAINPMKNKHIRKVPVEMDEDELGGITQLRGPASSGQDKLRLTFLMRQCISKYFGYEMHEAPESYQLPSVLISAGQHCRLDNITMDGKWKEDECFHVGDEQVIRTKGEKVPKNCMKIFRSIREKHPDLLEGLVIMQQPNAWRDEVITKWCYEDLASRCPYSIVQHDLVGHQLTNNTRKVKFMSNIVQSLIAAEMTSVLQITDIAGARSAKIHLASAKSEMRRQLAHKAQSEGTSSKCPIRNKEGMLG